MKTCQIVDQPAGGVYHIRDELGVCVTLIVGENRALLFDTGYGLGGLRGIIRDITDKPLTVVNSHGHWDHALGNWMFPEARLHPDDFALYESVCAPGARLGTLRRAEQEDALPPGFDREEYLNAPNAKIIPETGETLALGGVDAQIIPMPGHTRGSVVLYLPQKELIVMGDNWNPTVWVFFAYGLPVFPFREALRDILKLPFRQVLTSHGERAYPRETLEQYVLGMTDELILNAPKDRDTPYWQDYDTRRCSPLPGMPLVFDGQRIR